jgi:hypothetical protein
MGTTQVEAIDVDNVEIIIVAMVVMLTSVFQGVCDRAQ